MSRSNNAIKWWRESHINYLCDNRRGFEVQLITVQLHLKQNIVADKLTLMCAPKRKKKY